MANRMKGEVEFTAGDKTYTLRLSTNALAIAEELLDKGINEIAEMLGDAQTFRIGTARALLFSGLREYQPGITLEEAGEIIGEIGIPGVVTQLGASMHAAFPQAESGKSRPQKAGPHGTGKGS